MRKTFIVRVNEYNHVLFTKSFVCVNSLVDLPSDEVLRNSKIEKINADPEDQSASEYDLYKITFPNGFVDCYAIEIPYHRAAKARIVDTKIVIKLMTFGERGIYPDTFDFYPSEYLGLEWETIDDLKQLLFDACRDQLDSVFGLLEDDDYQAIYDTIEDWVDKTQSEMEDEAEIERIEHNPSLF